jgi:hypothetical protein
MEQVTLFPALKMTLYKPTFILGANLDDFSVFSLPIAHRSFCDKLHFVV